MPSAPSGVRFGERTNSIRPADQLPLRPCRDRARTPTSDQFWAASVWRAIRPRPVGLVFHHWWVTPQSWPRSTRARRSPLASIPFATIGAQSFATHVPSPVSAVSWAARPSAKKSHFVSSTFTATHAFGSDVIESLLARSRKRRAGGSQSEKRSKLSAAPAKSRRRQRANPSA